MGADLDSRGKKYRGVTISERFPAMNRKIEGNRSEIVTPQFFGGDGRALSQSGAFDIFETEFGQSREKISGCHDLRMVSRDE